MLSVTSRSIVDQGHRALLFVCVVAMVFCWTQAMRSRSPLPARISVAAAADATESIIAQVRRPVTALRDAVFLATGRFRSQQTVQDVLEPVLPIAETIAARSGGFFPSRDSLCVNCTHATSTTALSQGLACTSNSYGLWDGRGAIDPSVAARVSGRGVDLMAEQLGLRCGRLDHGE